VFEQRVRKDGVERRLGERKRIDACLVKLDVEPLAAGLLTCGAELRILDVDPHHLTRRNRTCQAERDGARAASGVEHAPAAP